MICYNDESSGIIDLLHNRLDIWNAQCCNKFSRVENTRITVDVREIASDSVIKSKL